MLGFFFYVLFLAELQKLSIFSHDICFDFRLIRFILTLHVSTATIVRAFLAMKNVKIRLRSQMKNDFLANYLIIYIVKEIIERFTIDMIIDYFYSMKERRAQLK